MPPSADPTTDGAPVLVMVLPNGQTEADYAEAHREDRAPDRAPYGLEQVGPDRVVAFSELTTRRSWQRVLSGAAFRLTGVDLVGGLIRRPALLRADVVYAHTEVEYLAAAAALLGRHRPMIVGQTIWLFAEFGQQPLLHRMVIRLLWRRVDLFIHNAAPNAALAARLLPGREHVTLPFGVSSRFASAVRGAREDRPLVLSVGNDRARDWATLDAALRPLADTVEVRIASRVQPDGFEYATVAPTSTVTELTQLLEQAACLVVTTAPNGHASGITAVLEAALAGTPVVATTGGGIEGYFPGGELLLVPPGDPGAVQAAIETLLGDPDAAAKRGRALREATLLHGYTNGEYWTRVLSAVERARAGRSPDGSVTPEPGRHLEGTKHPGGHPADE